MDNVRMVKGEIVHTKIEEFWSATALQAEAGTNGYHGGDGGHGSRTYIRIGDIAGTDISFKTYKPDPVNGNGYMIIELTGDSELHTIIDCFRFIADTLDSQAKELSLQSINMKGE